MYIFLYIGTALFSNYSTLRSHARHIPFSFSCIFNYFCLDLVFFLPNCLLLYFKQHLYVKSAFLCIYETNLQCMFLH